jgi:DNA-binding PadR family transcriptional regulator
MSGQMKQPKISRLGYALLGLLQKPSSGYDLRKIFSSTAMMSYSDSPGAIYPALRRLEQRGLIVGKVEAGSGMRRRQLFRLTKQGADIIRGVDEVMLRFAFSDQAVGAQGPVSLLKSLEAELTAYVPELRDQLRAGTAAMPTSGRLALESGIRGYECLLQWTKDALATYEREKKEKWRGVES